EPVSAYRLGAAAGAPPAATRTFEHDPDAARRRAVSLGSIVFAVLGAPCAAVTLIGPLAVLLGFGTLFGALGTSVLPFLDSGPVRIPLLTLATLGATANLYTIWHARRLRKLALQAGEFLPETRLERRRALAVTIASIASLLAVGWELYAHQFV